MDEARNDPPPTKADLLKKLRETHLATGGQDKKSGHIFSRRRFLQRSAAAAAAMLVGSDTPRGRDTSKGQVVISEPSQPPQQIENLHPVSTIIRQIDEEARMKSNAPEFFHSQNPYPRIRRRETEHVLNSGVVDSNTHSIFILQNTLRYKDTGEEESSNVFVLWLNKQNNTTCALNMETIWEEEFNVVRSDKYSKPLTEEEVKEWYDGKIFDFFPTLPELQSIKKREELTPEEANGLLVALRQGSIDTSLMNKVFTHGP